MKSCALGDHFQPNVQQKDIFNSLVKE